MHEKGHQGPFSEVGSSKRLKNQATRARGNQIGKTVQQTDQFKKYYGRDPKSGAVFLISHRKGQPARYKRVNMRNQGPSINPKQGQRGGRDFTIAKRPSPTDSRRGREVLAGPKVNPNRKPEKRQKHQRQKLQSQRRVQQHLLKHLVNQVAPLSKKPMQKHGRLTKKVARQPSSSMTKPTPLLQKKSLKRLVASMARNFRLCSKRTRRKSLKRLLHEYTCMATQSREEPKGRSERQGQSIIQSSNRRDTESSRKKRTENSRTNQTEGKLPSTDGERERATDEGWEEDPFEAQFRGMGSLW